MTNKEHRLGVAEFNLVARHLNLEPVSLVIISAAMEEIDHIYGLDTISFDEKAQVLTISYDASRICIDNIENI